MNYSISLILLFFCFSYILPAQDYQVNDVAMDQYRGVFQLESNGFAAIYLKSGKWVVETLDNELSVISKKEIDINEDHSQTVAKVFSNESSFYVLLSHGKENHEIYAFDTTGELTASRQIKKEILSIYPTETGYFIVQSNGFSSRDSDIVSFSDNNLSQKWEKEFRQKFKMVDIYSRHTNDSSFSSRSFTDMGKCLNGILAWTSYGRPGISETITAINSEGEILIEHDIKEIAKALIYYVDKDFLYVNYDTYKSKLVIFKFDQTILKKLNYKGKTEGEITLIEDHNIYSIGNFSSAHTFIDFHKENETFYALGFNNETFEIRSIDSSIKSTESNSISRKENTISDATFALSSNAITFKIMMNAYSFYHFDEESKEFVFAYLYYQEEDEISKVSPQFSSKETDKSLESKNYIENKNLINKLNVRWYELYKLNESDAVFSYYNKQNKSIDFDKIKYN